MSYPGPDVALPRFVQKDRAESPTLPLFAPSGASAAATSGTYTLLDSAGTTVDTGAVTVPGGIPTYALASTFADSYTLPQPPWRERWALAGVDGAPATSTYEHEVQVCRVAPVQHVTVSALTKMHPEWARSIPKCWPSYDTPITTAWEELLTRLLGDGHLPQRTLNWWALSVVHRYWAASLVCSAFEADAPGDSRWARKRVEYWDRSQHEYEHHLKLQKDTNEDGVADTPGKVEAASPPLYLTHVPAGRWS